MNVLKKILLPVFVLLFVLIDANAQSDSVYKDGYIPLFDNLQSDDASSMEKQYNNELKISVPQNYMDVKEEDVVPALKSLFAVGKYTEVVALAKSTSNYFKKKDKNTCQYSIYYLSALKKTNYDEKADSLVKVFCYKFPFYKMQKDDPIVFAQLMENYYTRPLFSVGVSVSKLFPIIKVDTIFNIASNDTARMVNYSDFKYSMNEAFLQFYISQKISVSVGVACSKLEFVRQSGENTYKDKNTFIQFPLSLNYTFKYIFTQGLIPEIFVGAKIGFTSKKEYDVDVIRLSDNLSYYEALKTDTISEVYKPNVSDKYYNYALVGGFRLNYNIRRFCFFAQYNFGCYLKQLDSYKQRYNDDGMSFFTGIVPDVVHVVENGLSIGVKMNFCYKTYTKYNYGY